MEEKPKDENSEPESGSLEDQTTVVDPTGSAPASTDSGATPAGDKQPEIAKPKRTFKDRLLHQNIYLLLFFVLILLSVVFSVAVYLHGKRGQVDSNGISSQSLSPDSLTQLANSDVTVGDPKQVLTVQSNAIFAGSVLVQKDLEIAGKLKVGSSLSLTGITVAGQSIFDDLQVTKNLIVAGDLSVQGKFNTKSIGVTGDATFGGTVTATNIVANALNISGDLKLTHHIVAGGATPTRSNGSALGSGGTSSVSGSDTSGSITINTGGSAGAGCFITVNFRQKFNSTPQVIISPVGSGAAGLSYYATRTTTSFKVCTASNPPDSTTFGFDYMVLE
ncbi:hypothetical protein KDA23_00225 [Candidatus Saccharibacteria bacterium]|nr:hypothetical protein [Candidatus Saccharibacteria bacterium]